MKHIKLIIFLVLAAGGTVAGAVYYVLPRLAPRMGEESAGPQTEAVLPSENQEAKTFEAASLQRQIIPGPEKPEIVPANALSGSIGYLIPEKLPEVKTRIIEEKPAPAEKASVPSKKEMTPKKPGWIAHAMPKPEMSNSFGKNTPGGHSSGAPAPASPSSGSVDGVRSLSASGGSGQSSSILDHSGWTKDMSWTQKQSAAKGSTFNKNEALVQITEHTDVFKVENALLNKVNPQKENQVSVKSEIVAPGTPRQIRQSKGIHKSDGRKGKKWGTSSINMTTYSGSPAPPAAQSTPAAQNTSAENPSDEPAGQAPNPDNCPECPGPGERPAQD